MSGGRRCAAALAAVVVMTAALLSTGGVAADGARVRQARAPESAIAAGTALLTVDDTALGVTWLADADLAAQNTFGISGINRDGSMTYTEAHAWVAAMDRADYLGHSDWTLPITPTPSIDPTCSGHNGKAGGNFGIGCRRSPFASLYSEWFGLRAPDTTVAIDSTATGPFEDFQPYLYWTDTSYTNSRGRKVCCFTFSFNNGMMGANTDLHSMYVLPIVPGNPFGATASADSTLARADNGQAVYQAVPGTSGITWLADADLGESETFRVHSGIARDGSMTQTAAAAWVAAMGRHGGWLGQSDWAFPTAAELAGLYRALGLSSEEPVVPVPDTTLHGFDDVQPYLYWSCAGVSITGYCSGAPSTGYQWSFSMGNGFQGTDLLSKELYVMVYYLNPAPGKPPPPTCKPAKPGTPSTCT